MRECSSCGGDNATFRVKDADGNLTEFYLCRNCRDRAIKIIKNPGTKAKKTGLTVGQLMARLRFPFLKKKAIEANVIPPTPVPGFSTVVSNPEQLGSKAEYHHHRQIPPTCFKSTGGAKFYTVPIKHTDYPRKGRYFKPGVKAIVGRLKESCLEKYGEPGKRVKFRAWAIQSILTPKELRMTPTRAEKKLEANPDGKPLSIYYARIRRWPASTTGETVEMLRETHQAMESGMQNPAEINPKMYARYSGWCRKCRGRINEGERIFWAPDVGAMHIECYRGKPRKPKEQPPSKPLPKPEKKELTPEEINKRAKELGREVIGEEMTFTRSLSKKRYPSGKMGPDTSGLPKIGEIIQYERKPHLVIGVGEPYYHSEEQCEDMGCFCGRHGWNAQYSIVPVSMTAEEKANEERYLQKKADLTLLMNLPITAENLTEETIPEGSKSLYNAVGPVRGFIWFSSAGHRDMLLAPDKTIWVDQSSYDDMPRRWKITDKAASEALARLLGVTEMASEKPKTVHEVMKMAEKESKEQPTVPTETAGQAVDEGVTEQNPDHVHDWEHTDLNRRRCRICKKKQKRLNPDSPWVDVEYDPVYGGEYLPGDTYPYPIDFTQGIK